MGQILTTERYELKWILQMYEKYWMKVSELSTVLDVHLWNVSEYTNSWPHWCHQYITPALFSLSYTVFCLFCFSYWIWVIFLFLVLIAHHIHLIWLTVSCRGINSFSSFSKLESWARWTFWGDLFVFEHFLFYLELIKLLCRVNSNFLSPLFVFVVPNFSCCDVSSFL